MLLRPKDQHRPSLAGLICYLPTGKITLENDGIRCSDIIFQKDIDQWVLCNKTDLEIAENRVLMVESTGINERTEECIKMINSLLRKQAINSGGITPPVPSQNQ